ncbi:MAG: hypothetical protein RI894_2548 [Bacteroidota bacterium]|jgi:type IX secretion system PorP/SprF family membrane protein
MKKFYTLFAAVVMAVQANAQQEALLSQWVQSPFLVNPAAAGSSKMQELRIFHRWQWVAFPGAPITFGINYHSGYKNNGFGGELYVDNTGPTHRYGASLSYAYHLQVAKDAHLALGVQGKFMRWEVNTHIIHFADPTDPIANNTFVSNRGEAAAGLYFYSPKFTAGISGINLATTPLGILDGSVNDVARYYRHFNVFGTGNFDLQNKELTLVPNLLLRFTEKTPIQYELGCRLKFNLHDFGVGMAYRGSASEGSPGFLSFNFNTILDKQYPIIIGFDVALGQFSNYSSFAYELMGGYDFYRKDMGTNYLTKPEN